jgi:hypothetical protein
MIAPRHERHFPSEAQSDNNHLAAKLVRLESGLLRACGRRHFQADRISGERRGSVVTALPLGPSSSSGCAWNFLAMSLIKASSILSVIKAQLRVRARAPVPFRTTQP